MTDTTEWTPERRKEREDMRAGALALPQHKQYTWHGLGDDSIASPDACPTCGHAPTKHAGFHLTETCRCPRTEEAKS